MPFPCVRLWFCCCGGADDASAVAEIPTLQAMPQRDPVSELQQDDQLESEGPAAPSFGSFTVVIPTQAHATLGLMWDSASEAAGPMVLDVQSTGAVPKFNQLHPKQAIRPNDVIASIDDESQHAAVLSKLNGPLPDQVKLVVKRPREVKVSLSKPGALGMKLDYQETSIGAVISELMEGGLVAKWNSDHPSDAIGLGDRIAQVNGEKLSGAKLLPKLKAEDKLVLTVLKY